MASEVSICNIAIQKVGGTRITSLTQANSREAFSCNNCYAEMRDLELRAHVWNFSRKRVILAPDSVAPLFDFGYAFTLPTDCLRPIIPTRLNIDWQIESNKILTNDGTSINLVYIAQITDPNAMDELFRELLACRIAAQICEEITQSGSKLQNIAQQYKDAKAEARKINAIEQGIPTQSVAPWDAIRL